LASGAALHGLYWTGILQNYSHMEQQGYFAKKISTLRKLFYYRVIINGERLKARLLKKISRPAGSYDLVMIDDVVPKGLSGFRNYEFVFLLNTIKNSAVYSIMGNNLSPKKALQYFPIKKEDEYNASRDRFCRDYGIDRSKLHPFFPWTNIKAKLAYVVFLTNADYLIDYLEAHSIKFILELYPGGGLTVLTEGPTFNNLKRVLNSPCLETVIATQINTYNFLLEHKVCDKDKVVFIYGGILAPEFMAIPPKEVRYPLHKDTIDICFGAAKYMPQGQDKGYDVFIEMAHLLLARSDKFRFHIIGDFNEHDIPLAPQYRQYFTYHGFLKNENTIPFYKDKDIFVSPNRAFVLGNGAFDGFPTGTAAEAGLQGLCVLLTDPLKLNIFFDEGRDAIFLQPDANQFADFIIHLSADPAEIYNIGERGKLALQKAFDYKAQLDMRLALINKSLHK